MSTFTKEQLEDAAQFGNFAQRIKIAYYKKYTSAKESTIDEILLLTWQDLKDQKNKEKIMEDIKSKFMEMAQEYVLDVSSLGQKIVLNRTQFWGILINKNK